MIRIYIKYGNKSFTLWPLIEMHYHARKRYKERYGKKMSRKEVQLLAMSFQLSAAQHVTTIDEKRRIHKVHYDGRDVYFIYDKNTKRILTFYKKEWVDKIIEKRNET